MKEAKFVTGEHKSLVNTKKKRFFKALNIYLKLKFLLLKEYINYCNKVKLYSN